MSLRDDDEIWRRGVRLQRLAAQAQRSPSDALDAMAYMAQNTLQSAQETAIQHEREAYSRRLREKAIMDRLEEMGPQAKTRFRDDYIQDRMRRQLDWGPSVPMDLDDVERFFRAWIVTQWSRVEAPTQIERPRRTVQWEQLMQEYQQMRRKPTPPAAPAPKPKQAELQEPGDRVLELD